MLSMCVLYVRCFLVAGLIELDGILVDQFFVCSVVKALYNAILLNKAGDQIFKVVLS